ncbi:MAG: AtpZ/AtpI family protein [Bacillota bacterium]
MASKNGWGRVMQVFALTSSISVQFAVSVVLGWWIGDKLDKRFQSEIPWMTIVGLLVGVGAGVYGIINIMGRFSLKDEEK